MNERTLVLAVLLAATLSPANGYKILCVRSAKATAMGEAFVVQADDPTAVAFNPAGIADLRGVQLSLQGTWCNAYAEHTAPNGAGTDMDDGWQLVPSFFATWDMGTERFALGFGASLPNGLSSSWDEDSFAGYAGYHSDLTIADYSIALGWRVTDSLSVGAGINYYGSDLDQRQRLSLPGILPDPFVYLEGTGEAWGFNLGVRYKINERHSVAATYRRFFTVDYEGDTELAGTGFYDSDGSYDMETSFDYPASLVLGYAYRPNERWTFEVNVDWTDWSRVDDVVVESPSLLLQRRTVIERDYRDTFAYKFGAQYRWSEALVLRAGYIYNENATPDAVWYPTQPDTDMHFFTCGFGCDVTEHVVLEAAFQLVYYETRDVTDGVAAGTVDGTYRTWAPCFTLGMTCRF